MRPRLPNGYSRTSQIGVITLTHHHEAHATPRPRKSRDEEPLRRLHLSYAGNVEDSGFRYHVIEKAHSLGLTGWLSRAFHGVAELFIQGRSKDVEEYLGTIDEDAQATGSIFCLADIEELTPVSGEDRFTVMGA